MRRIAAICISGTLGLIILSAVTGCPPQLGGDSDPVTTNPDTGTGEAFALAPTVVLTADVTIGVLPLTVNFNSTLSTDDGLIIARQWDFGDGGAASSIAPEHTFTATGVFTVTLTLTDDQGASASETIQITVTEAPVATFNLTPASATAENAPATFTFDPSGSFDPDGSLVEYRWDFGDGALLNLDQPEVVSQTYSRAGSYRVSLVVVDDIGVQSEFTRSIRVGIPQPAIEFVTPPLTTRRIITPQDSDLWGAVRINIEGGVPRFLSAGIDRDFDQCDAKAIIFVVGTGELVNELTGHDDRVTAAAFRPNDGDRVITASEDMTTRTYDQNGSFVLSFDGDSNNMMAVTAVDIAPLGNDGVTTFFYGLADGRVARQSVSSTAVPSFFNIHTARVNDIELLPDGTFAASGSEDGTVQVWQTSNGTVTSAATNAGTPHGGPVNDVSAAAIANVIASASDDQTVRVWQSPSFTTLVREFTGHNAAVNAVALSPNADRVISGDASGVALFWSPTDTSVLLDFTQSAAVTAVAFAPDPAVSRIAIGTSNGEVRIYDPLLGNTPLVTLTPCTSPITALEFSPSGAELLVGVAAQNSIQLDIEGNPNGNDLNFTLPQPLSVSNVPSLNGADVPAGSYFLWADIATDRTSTQRTYAGLGRNFTEPTEIIITPAHQSDLNTAPVRLPYAIGTNDALRDLADPAVAIQFTTPAPDRPVRRQIIDIGRLEEGDQILFSFISIPGFSPYFREDTVQSTLIDLFLFNFNNGTENDGAYSALLLNQLLDGGGTELSPANLIAWYSSTASELTPDTRLTIRRASDHHYFVVDSASSLRIEISKPANQTDLDQRLRSKDQRVLLDFNAAVQVAIGGITPVDLRSLDQELIARGLPPADIETIKSDLVARLQTLFADASFNDPSTGEPRGIQFFRSDVEIPAAPFKRINFGALNEFPTSGLGTVDVRSAQGQSQTGSGVVGVNADPDNNLYDLPVADMGNALANHTAHLLGRMLGLQATNGTATDIMDPLNIFDDPVLITYEFTDGPLPAFDASVAGPIGEQYAAEYLADIYGPEN